ncbi:uncharacterized protein LOC131648540 [Vicia villosa]|uniref:uncharacterized protein LOC131648540 n=1 Tax=Vicia villosa TaxID=3911 RepID=UPI00273BC346|nr:uncharacterized protein LOC131648540 [Vicia villosa]
MASSSSTKVSMKLLIDTKNNKVLFAEASKPVIDFLFNLLCLPIGTVVKLLSSNNMNYMQPFQTKDVLLNPKAQSSSTQISGFLTRNHANEDKDEEIKLFMCPNKCKFEVTKDNTTRCTSSVNIHSPFMAPAYSSCSNFMSSEVHYIGNKKVAEKKSFSNNKSGFVKYVITFMVMDDLVIHAMSTISSITLLNKFNIKEIGTLQEKIVEMGMNMLLTHLLSVSLCLIAGMYQIDRLYVQ